MAQTPTVQEAVLPWQVVEYSPTDEAGTVIARFNLEDDADDFRANKKFVADLRERALRYDVREDPAWVELRTAHESRELRRDPAATLELAGRDV